MVKEFLKAHPLVKILGKKNCEIVEKKIPLSKLKNIPSSTKIQGGVAFQS